MPRTGGVYYLPSPPSPYIAGTLAAAEDINATLNDLAVAMTGSLPTDGSAAMTGALNANGHPITGVSTLQASTLTSTGTLNAATLNVTGGASIGALLSSLNANGQNITGAGQVTAGYLYSSGTVQAGGAVNGASLGITGNAQVNGTVYAGATQTTNNTYSGSYTGQWMEVQWIATSSDVDVGGNCNVTGGVQGPWATLATLYGTTVYAGWANGVQDFYLSGDSNNRYLIFEGVWGAFRFNSANGSIAWMRNNQVLMQMDYQGNMYVAGFIASEQGPMRSDAEPAISRTGTGSQSISQRLEALEQEVEDLRARLAVPV